MEDLGTSDSSVQEKIERIANKAAEKPGKTVKKFDKENSSLFTR